MKTIHNALLVAICRGMVARGIKPAVLEIGTYDGANSRILASLVTEARITTYDLPPYDTRILAHNPSASNAQVLKSIYKDRLRNTSEPSIKYVEESSTNILNGKQKRWDVVWVDGDHSYPQVAFDIMTAIAGVKDSKHSVVLCDDVFPIDTDPSFQCLKAVCLDTDFKFTLFQKRSLGDKCVALMYREWPFKK